MNVATGKILLGTVIAATAVCAVIYGVSNNDVAPAEETRQTAPVSDVQNNNSTEVGSAPQSAEISNEERAKQLYNNPPTNVNGQTEDQTR